MGFKMIIRLPKTVRSIVAALAFPALLGGLAPLFAANPDVDREILKEMQERRIPSVVAGIIKKDSIVWLGAYGLADRENNIPATSQTIYMLASLSKPVIATAVMQLVDRGLIDINRDIGLYLPFSVRNPLHPNSIVTPRMLLTHSSGLAGPETDDELRGFYDWFPPDSAPSLGWTIMDYLLPGGLFYVPAVWKDNPPGDRELYSNLGATLLAYMVEFVSGEEFSSYCRNNIFLPLAMPGTSYRISDLDPDKLAIRYLENAQSIPHYTRRDYPAGQVKSSVAEFSHFLAAWMNDGVYNGSRILTKRSVDEALRLHNPASGICLAWNLTLGGWHGHSGGVSGASAYMEFHRQDGVGLIVCSNVFIKDSNPFYPPAGRIYGLIRNLANGFRDPQHQERNSHRQKGTHKNN
jgi:CubicO group peptidase (beta-lactamase class C family)